MKPITDKTSFATNFVHSSIFLILCLLEGLAAFIFLALIPSDNENGLLLGFSASRLILIFFHLLLLLITFYLVFLDRRMRFSLLHRLDKFRLAGGDIWIGLASFLLAAGAFLILQSLHSLYMTTGSFREFAYFQRLLPTLGWLFLVGIQAFLWLILKNRQALWDLVKHNRSALIPTVVMFAVFLLVALFASTTGIGLRTDKYGWGAPGVPLMEWQIWFSILFALGASAILGGTALSTVSLSKKDIFICIGIWLAAVIIWGTQPVPPGFFATPGRPPNFEIYPFSDGAFYDFYAQNIIIGNGYRGAQIPPRPLYILFLAIDHFIVGQDYNLVVLVQTLLLALIPVLFFLLGRFIHSPAAGLAAAVMSILRELTTILSTPFTDDVSNSKLLFADLPSTLGIALVILLVFLWLRNPWKRSGLQLASGLAMGILLLVRTQSLLLLPVIFVFALIIYRKKLLQFLLDFGLFSLILAITIAPWLLRNHAIAGQFIFDHPESQARVMAQRYDFNGDFESLERQPGEGTGEYSDRLSASIKQTIFNHPFYVAGFVTSHFLNNEIGDLLILPLRNGLSAPQELIFPTAPFWQEWDGQITWKQGLLLAANLLVISLGIGVSWKKYNVLGLLPLFVNLTYNLSTAVARYSGWRYLLPVDWITYFYYAIGMVALLSYVFRNKQYRQGKGPTTIHESPSGKPTDRLLLPPFGRSIAILVLSLLFGASLILAEKIIPPRYSPEQNREVIREMLDNPAVISSGLDIEALKFLQTQPNAFIVKGRALYPRYYQAGEGESKTAKTGYEPSPDARLVFLVASTPDGLTIFRTTVSPDYFPNAVDVSIVGCQHPLYAEAWIITVHGDKEVTYISPDAFGMECKE